MTLNFKIIVCLFVLIRLRFCSAVFSLILGYEVGFQSVTKKRKKKDPKKRTQNMFSPTCRRNPNTSRKLQIPS